MGRLTFALNVTLDGCCDHRAMVPDDEMLRYFTRLIRSYGGILYGRTTYEMMESYWPAVARDPKASRADRDWARALDAIPKHVVSSTRRNFPWSNSRRVEGELSAAVKALKKRTPKGLLVGSPMLSAELQRLGLIDEYVFVVHRVIAGHGPTLFAGLRETSRLTFVDAKRLKSGTLALRYRRA